MIYLAALFSLERFESVWIKNKATKWREQYLPQSNDENVVRFVEILGRDLGGSFDSLTPDTPLDEIAPIATATTRISNMAPHKNWVDMLLAHAEIENIETTGLGGKTLRYVVESISSAKNAG